MKIKIALISGEHIREAHDLSITLKNAMEAGEMRQVDQTTHELLSLTDKDCSLSVSEENWHKMIEQVRSFDVTFKSDYIMERPQLERIMAAGLTTSFVDIASVVEHALKNEGAVLQLPFDDEEDDNVF